MNIIEGQLIAQDLKIAIVVDIRHRKLPAVT